MKINPNIPYTDTFIGHVSADNVGVMNRIRTAIKGTGFYLTRRGRHSNRKQFIGQRITNTLGTWTYSHRNLRQDVPLSVSTHFALYVDSKVRDWASPLGSPTRGRTNKNFNVEDVKALIAKALVGFHTPHGVLTDVKTNRLAEVITSIGL